jgi:hypothetical protein
LIIPIDLKPLKATMPTTTPTILDQISAEKTKISERLAPLRPLALRKHAANLPGYRVYR